MIKVLVADDHSLVRKGLKTLLEGEDDIEVVGEATDGKEAIEKAKELQPEIILLDLSMPDIDGIEATKKISAADLDSKVLILTVHEDEEYFKEALEAGGAGYILKKAADIELLSAIRAVYREEVFICPSMTKILLDNYLKLGESLNNSREQKRGLTSISGPDNEDKNGLVDNYDLLSKREKEVFELVAKGYTNKEIAEELVISVKTVETHKFRMKKKLELNKRSEIVQLALKKGIL